MDSSMASILISSVMSECLKREQSVGINSGMDIYAYQPSPVGKRARFSSRPPSRLPRPPCLRFTNDWRKESENNYHGARL